MCLCTRITYFAMGCLPSCFTVLRSINPECFIVSKLWHYFLFPSQRWVPFRLSTNHFMHVIFTLVEFSHKQNAIIVVKTLFIKNDDTSLQPKLNSFLDWKSYTRLLHSRSSTHTRDFINKIISAYFAKTFPIIRDKIYFSKSIRRDDAKEQHAKMTSQTR